MSTETILFVIIISGVVLLNILIGKSKNSSRNINAKRRKILRRYEDDDQSNGDVA